MFKKALMENDKYKSWLKPGTSVYSTKCSFCVSEFNVAWRSESAVRSHECGSAHVRNMTDLEKAKSLAPLFFGRLQYILVQVVPQLLVYVRSLLLLPRPISLQQ